MEFDSVAETQLGVTPPSSRNYLSLKIFCNLYLPCLRFLKFLPKRCGATFIVIGLIISHKFWQKNPRCFCCKARHSFNTCPTTPSSRLRFRHHFGCLFWHKWDVKLDKNAPSSICFTLIPGRDVSWHKSPLKNQFRTISPLSSLPHSLMRFTRVPCKPLLDGAQHLSMLVTVYPSWKKDRSADLKCVDFTPNNQRCAVAA